MDRENGEAGAAGQPPLPAFPKAFVEDFIEVFAGLTGTPEPCDESAFQLRFDPLVEFFETRFADDHLAIDKESRGSPDLQYLAGVFAVGRDLFEQRLILQAVLDGLCAQPCLPPDQLA